MVIFGMANYLNHADLLVLNQRNKVLYCLLFQLHHLEISHHGRILSLNFRVFTVKLVGV